MNIILNGERHETPAAQSISSLLLQLGLAEKRLAVELNREVLPRSAFDCTQLAEGDRIEIVHAIGGG